MTSSNHGPWLIDAPLPPASLVPHLRSALETKLDLVPTSGVGHQWSGPNEFGPLLEGRPSPSSRFTAHGLAAEAAEGRDPIDTVLMLAIELGMHQGVLCHAEERRSHDLHLRLADLSAQGSVAADLGDAVARFYPAGADGNPLKPCQFDEVVDALRAAFESNATWKPRRNAPRIRWDGPNTYLFIGATSMVPAHALSDSNLKHTQTERGRDIPTTILGTAFQLGIENGRRAWMCRFRASGPSDVVPLLERARASFAADGDDNVASLAEILVHALDLERMYPEFTLEASTGRMRARMEANPLRINAKLRKELSRILREAHGPGSKPEH